MCLTRKVRAKTWNPNQVAKNGFENLEKNPQALLYQKWKSIFLNVSLTCYSYTLARFY